MPKQPDSQIQKVISSYELEKHTIEGWIVIDSFTIDDCVHFDDQVAHPRAGEKYPDGHYGTHGGNVIPESILLRRQKVGQVLKFLVAKGFDQRLMEMETNLEGVRDQYSDAMKENQSLKQWKANAEGTYTDLQSKHEAEKKRYVDAYGAKCNLEKRVRAMEKDLAKVRTAIGEKQMNEILSDDQSA
jgi:hypothetical protein